MTNYDALKAIYEALGGSGTIEGTNLDALRAIASVASGGGSGGAGVEIITYTTQDGETFECDHTAQEIYELVDAGKYCVAHYGDTYLPLGTVGIYEGSYSEVMFDYTYFRLTDPSTVEVYFCSIAHGGVSAEDEYIRVYENSGSIAIIT